DSPAARASPGARRRVERTLARTWKSRCNGRPSTAARWGGPGERGEKGYARNRRCYSLTFTPARNRRMWAGGGGTRCLQKRRELPGRVVEQVRKATGKVCGVPVARPPGALLSSTAGGDFRGLNRNARSSTEGLER